MDMSLHLPLQTAPAESFEMQNQMHEHQYGDIIASGSSRMQVGDATYNMGSGTQLHGPTTVHSTTTINYQQPTGPSYGPTQSEDPLTSLKRILYYPSMEVRGAQLAGIDAASFDWIWTDTDFTKFLQSEQALFWVQGKPASGKSTLMHYLASTPLVKRKIREHLQGDNHSIQVIHFYFDFRASSGTANTSAGMLRALMLQLVCQCSPIADAVLQEVGYRINGGWQNLPEEMISILSKALESTNLFVLGLIDGLDEYSGSTLALLDIISAIRDHCRIKLCVASRPEPVIQFRLQEIPGFAMQTFNSATIKHYVQQRFVGLEAYIEAYELKEFAKWIEDHAEGVILWARFACDELVPAILHGESSNEIRARLQGYSPDLKDVYDRIWQDIDHQKRVQASLAFYLVDQWHTMPSESASLTWIHENHWEPIKLNDFFVRWCEVLSKVTSSNENFENYGAQRFKLYMNRLLKGLLVFEDDYTQSDEDTPVGNKTCVRILHKTLRPFLDQCTTYQDLVEFVISKAGVLSPLGVYYATVIEEMASHLKLEESVTSVHHRLVWSQRLERLDCSCNSLCRLPKRLSLSNALRLLFGLAYMDLPPYVSLFRSAIRSWLFQRFGYFPEGTIDLRIPPTSIICRSMEVVAFITARYYHAFHDYVCEHYDFLTKLDWDILCCHLIASVRLKFSKLCKNFELIAFQIFAQVAPGAIYVAVCAIDTPKSGLFYLQPAHPLLVDLSKVELKPSRWWNHSNIDLLCCWAWSPYSSHHVVVQRMRLQMLLRADISINKKVYKDGNVLHALLEIDPVRGKRFLHKPDPNTVTGNEYSHISKEKLDVLLENGVDVNQGSIAGKPIDVANHSLNILNLQASTHSLEPPFRLLRMISWFEDYIIPTLERYTHG